ncbi:unnamed protein product [Sphagnum compactum]
MSCKLAGVSVIFLVTNWTVSTALENFTVSDFHTIQVALNLEWLEAEYFLWASYGYGLDIVDPSLPNGGPEPVGVQKAKLDTFTTDIFVQLGLQEVGHLRAIKEALGTYFFPRVQLDLSKDTWAKIFDNAFGEKLHPSFDPYANSLNYLISTYTIPYVGLTGYVGAAPLLTGEGAKALVAGLLGVEAGQDAIIRSYLYEKKNEVVKPYKYTVADFTNKVSSLRDSLSHAFVDKGLEVPKHLGAEGKVSGNILSADVNSVAFARTAKQVFETVYGTGDASKPGGFYPMGGNGTIALSYLNALA